MAETHQELREALLDSRDSKGIASVIQTIETDFYLYHICDQWLDPHEIATSTGVLLAKQARHDREVGQGEIGLYASLKRLSPSLRKQIVDTLNQIEQEQKQEQAAPANVLQFFRD